MEIKLKKHLDSIVAAFKLTDQQQLLFCDRPISIDVSAYQSNPQQAAKDAIVNALYLHTHCQAFGENSFEPAGDATNNRDITAQLSKANLCQGRWDQGWIVEQVLANGAVAVRRGQDRSLLNVGEFVLEEPYSAGVATGSRVQVFRPHESSKLQEGVYFTFSTNQPLALAAHSQLVRFYLNVKLTGASSLVEHLPQLFERFQVPFRFKIMAQSQFFYRIDTAVLYVPAEYHQISAALLHDLYPTISKQMGQEVCLFTKPLLPGLSFAEDPADGQSFGMSRCGVMANAVLNLLQKGSTSADQRLMEIEQAFTAQGICLNAPYLNPGSVDCYDFSSNQPAEAA